MRQSRASGRGGYSVTSMSTYETNLRKTLGEFLENWKLSTPRGKFYSRILHHILNFAWVVAECASKLIMNEIIKVVTTGRNLAFLMKCTKVKIEMNHERDGDLAWLSALLVLQHWTSLKESDQLHFEIEQLKLKSATAIVHWGLLLLEDGANI